MSCGGEALPVGPDFGDHNLGSATLDAGNALQPSEGVVTMCEAGGDVLRQGRDLAISEGHMLQLDPEH